MEKRAILAIVLCVVVWFLFSPKKKQEPVNTIQPAETQKQIAASAPATDLEKKEGSTEAEKEARLINLPTLPEKKILLENDDFLCTFSNHGAKLISIKLKKYKKSLKKDSENIDLIYDNLNRFGIPNWSFIINKDLYEDSQIYYSYGTKDNNTVTYRANLGPVLIEKIYVIPEKGYLIDIKLKIRNTGNSKVSLTPYLGIAESLKAVEKKKSLFFGYPNNLSAIVNINGKIKRTDLAEMNPEDAKELYGNIMWFGVDDKYFIKSAIPTVTLGEQMLFEKNSDDYRSVKLRYSLKELSAGDEKIFGYNLYAGPKEIDTLENLGNNFNKAIDLGDWIGPIARPMLSLLKWIHKYIPNFGLAIILLTILVKIVLYPISRKQYKSMEAMKRLQPQINSIKERFKDDKQKMNMEMMNLFKTHKVNPMGGCLPMFLQMPIFFALYRVLYNSIELRHSPFVFWIKDLSAPDPYYITPVLMGITMFLQQVLTPQPSTDPTQAKVMKIMPIMFSLFMLALPSGLVIYIFVSSLITVVTQQLKNITKGESVWTGKNLKQNLLMRLKKRQ